ncbi:Hermansky-Pudlak syndrome 5 protein homolog [Tribolium madens]|uniref:Hermansky-Pudlak syndrome 5 protein homolog n=1 Tax=Tribolium madens TaxID=41895 RepID=UPI001CF7317E|nr:Hermansky-Pudlak syndrome 5 protein homolog [Tribolium madens]
MTEKYALVEHSSTLNNIIRNTFETTHRIKFTAFDVSHKYAIFGVNSGGIYIFSRESCQFLKLIPSTHGPANLLFISPNEKNLAIAVLTGLVVVLEDFSETDFQQQIFTEHEGNNITAIKWNGNDLYCGDNTGRVSVVALRNFLTVFQTPVACLMHLDSPIVQLDTYSKFLLVSTQTRSLLCDTESEKYRQIGKKMRDGTFGACFVTAGNPDKISDTSARTRGLFEILGDSEQLSAPMNDDKVKIYCARPGVRLWQADFQANVVVTHQFRSSLGLNSSKVVQWDDSDQLKMKILPAKIGEFNFGKIYSFLNRFILTFRDDGCYIFDPFSSTFQYWSTHASIKDVKIVDSFLYVWHNDLEVSVLSLLTVEELVLRSLMRKKYKLCSEICLEFYDDVQLLIETSKKIHLISILESKLDDCEVLLKLGPIFKRLKDCAAIPTLERYKNGIVTVNALPVLPESVENFQGDKDTKKQENSILVEQFKVNKINKTIETSDFTQFMKTLNPNELYDVIRQFEQESSESCDDWCKEMFLKYIKISPEINPEALDYTYQAFFHFNMNKKFVCSCNFPLPQAHEFRPKFYEIGTKLMDKSDHYEDFLKNVPYMYKYVLEKISDTKEIHLKLPLIIQFSDSKIIEIHLNKLTYDLWDESICFLLKLKSGQCLNCGAKVDIAATFDWTNFGTKIVDSIKPTNALKLFKRYAHLLPKGELKPFFYQYCIFSTASNIKNDIFKRTLENENASKQFETAVGGYLRKKYLCGDLYDPPNRNSMDLINCDHCHLPLKIPILEENTKLTCGHNYHQTCLLHNKSQCPKCELL